MADWRYFQNIYVISRSRHPQTPGCAQTRSHRRRPSALRTTIDESVTARRPPPTPAPAPSRRRGAGEQSLWESRELASPQTARNDSEALLSNQDANSAIEKREGAKTAKYTPYFAVFAFRDFPRSSRVRGPAYSARNVSSRRRAEASASISTSTPIPGWSGTVIVESVFSVKFGSATSRA